jgi:hypothetical protein
MSTTGKPAGHKLGLAVTVAVIFVVALFFIILFACGVGCGTSSGALPPVSTSWALEGSQADDIKIPTLPGPPSPKTLTKQCMDFMQNNTLAYGQLRVPLGYYVAADYFPSIPKYSQEAFATKNSKDRYDDITAIINQTIGFSTYDASVWAISVVRHSETDKDYWHEKAGLFLSYLTFASDYPQTGGSLLSPRPFVNVPSVDPASNWVYNTVAATNTATEDTDHADIVGYHFRNLPSNGYQVDLPPWVCSVGNHEYGNAGKNLKIDSTIYAGCNHLDLSTDYEQVKQLKYIHSDYRPVTGENMWALSAACDVYDTRKPADYATLALPYLALRLATTIGFLESVPGTSGSPYYSPQRNNINEWNVYQYSVENMASSVAALIKFADTDWAISVVNEEHKMSAMKLAGRIACRIIKTHMQKDYSYDHHDGGTILISGWSINQGGLVVPANKNRVIGGQQMHSKEGFTNGKQFATDCTTWVIAVLGDKIEAEEKGRCFELWENCKTACGYLQDGVCKGFGYSFNAKSNVHSSEWSIGGLFAAQFMKDKLYAGDAAKVQVLTSDIRNFEQKLVEQTSGVLNITGKGLNYCNQKDFNIPFGWLGQENPSMASTGWYVFWLEKRNPWRLDGKMDFCTFELQQVPDTPFI